jgi:hypothetical protein
MDNDNKLTLFLVIATFIALSVGIAFALMETKELNDYQIQETPV